MNNDEAWLRKMAEKEESYNFISVRNSKMLPVRPFRRSILCRLGIHRWKRTGPRYRYCRRCPKKQLLHFYSNRTQEWVDI